MKATPFCLSVIFVLLAPISLDAQEQPEHTFVRLDRLPACSQQSIGDTNSVISNQFSLNVQNLKHHQIFKIPSQKAPWEPVTGLRKTVCGRLKKYRVETEAHPEDKEYDWNLDIIPSAAFDPSIPFDRSIISQNLLRTFPGTCLMNLNCIEGEITPASDLRNNRIFPPQGEENRSPLIDKQICIYGPWVRDDGNNDHLEIHPAEAIWWQNTPGSNLDVELMLIQDASINRFTEFCHYNFDEDGDGVSNFQQGWAPWVEYPHTEEIKIPFQYDPRTRNFAVINIVDVRSLKIVTHLFPELGDSDDGAQHKLKLLPRPNVPVSFDQTLVEVRERNDAHQGVQFSDLCKVSNGVIRGNVRVLTAIGQPDTRDPGFIVLRFQTTFGTNRPINTPR